MRLLGVFVPECGVAVVIKTIEANAFPQLSLEGSESLDDIAHRYASG